MSDRPEYLFLFAIQMRLFCNGVYGTGRIFTGKIWTVGARGFLFRLGYSKHGVVRLSRDADSGQYGRRQITFAQWR